MTDKDRYLVVVSVLEGRKFPKRPHHKIIIEARFDGELLATDPVDHSEMPELVQELAWELDKKGLQQHRLQRSSIKVQCYAQDNGSSVKQAIGYVVLDLRSAQSKQVLGHIVVQDLRSAQSKQTSKWYPLLHTKYHKTRPEVRLGIYLDEDKSDPAAVKTKEAVGKRGSAASVTGGGDSDIELQGLRPVLNEAEGYYQIGPEAQCNEQFVLSITITFGSNLPQLIPSTSPLPVGASTFFFYYSLFGNDVTNETFNDLLNPNFPVERASVRIRSSAEALRVFLLNQPGIQIHLCCGDQSLGSCEVSLSSLLKKGSTEIYMKPVTIEGSYQLVPPNKTKQQLPPVPQDQTPVVGLSIVLKKEDMTMKTPVKEAPQHSIIPQLSPITPNQDRFPRDAPAISPPTKQPKEKPNPKPTGPPRHPTDDGSYSETFEEDKTIEEASSLVADECKDARINKHDEKAAKSTKQVARQAAAPLVSDSSSTTQHHVAIPPQAHHFTFSIDLRSVQNVESPTAIKVFLRYTYPFFGSAAPVLTHPPVEIRKGTEVLLPQSFCAFDFACTAQQLQETFMRVPLVVEVWHRDRQLTKDVLLGIAKVPLAQVIAADKSRVMNDKGMDGWRQVYFDRIQAMATDSVEGHKVAEITAVLSLEDWGSVSTQVVIGSETSQQSVAPLPAAPVPSQEPRETAEYQAAMELELWKEAQEQMFETKFKEKEMTYMRALAEEWKKRDKERELIMKKKLSEYASMEEKLRKTIIDLEKRERQLSANEQEVMRLRDDLQREHDQKLQEMKEASRRMKDDCDHQVELEKNKSRELEEIISRCKHELLDAERKNQVQDKEFTIYKEQQNNKPEVRLQSEINLLTLEKVELERKLDTVTKSKVHYKQQWGRSLKELARLKLKEQAVARAQLKRQEQELEHMRLRYLAAEEKEVVKSERKELEDLKNELNKLRLLEEEKSKSHDRLNHQYDDGYDGMKPLIPEPDNGHEEHITRLIEERDTLLRTGVYSSQDRIIAELDRQIREAIVIKGS